MQQQDTPHDALVHLLQLLPQADRVRLSAVSTAWLRAAAETFKDVDAKLDNMKALVSPAALLIVCSCHHQPTWACRRSKLDCPPSTLRWQ